MWIKSFWKWRQRQWQSLWLVISLLRSPAGKMSVRKMIFDQKKWHCLHLPFPRDILILSSLSLFVPRLVCGDKRVPIKGFVVATVVTFKMILWPFSSKWIGQRKPETNPIKFFWHKLPVNNVIIYLFQLKSKINFAWKVTEKLLKIDSWC
jgi:hypothetical protein